MSTRKRKSDSLFSSIIKLTFAFLFVALSTYNLELVPKCSAQVLYGSLTGTVKDASGAIVSGARVTALETRTGISQQTTTDSAGIYRFTTLLPGTYKVTIAASGFSAQETSAIVVSTNEVARVDAQLNVAGASQTVTVTTEPPLLQTDRSDVRTDLNAPEVQSLPAISSEGRSFQALYKVIPGATLPMENNSAGGNPQRAMTSNVNGQSSQGNNTRIDGVQDAYPWLPNNIAYVPPTDAIQNVNVVTNSFDAEQGDASGAVVNVQIKSGTNQFHGDAHELYTGNALSAENYFNAPGFRIPLNVFNQFGGSVGGPIKKDKIFFFGDWESTRQVQAPAGGNPQTVPFGGLTYQAAQTAGFFDFRSVLPAGVNIYDPRTGNADGTGRSVITCNGVPNAICLSAVDPASLTMASLIPAANVPGSTSNNYFLTQTGYFHRNDFDGKVNWVPNQSTTVFGRYSLSQSNIFDPPALGPAEGNATLGGQLGHSYSRIQVVGLGGTYAFSPNLLLDLNGGFTRQRIDAEAPDINTDFGTNTLHIPGTNGSQPLQGGIPAFFFNTFSNIGNPNTGNPFLFRDNQYVGNANLTWVKGKHQLRFGIEYNHTQMNHFQPQGGTFQTARGSFSFTGAATELTGQPSDAQLNSYADFLLGLPDQVGKATQNLDVNALRWSTWAWYARDQFQVTPRLTINYGLRWEYYPMGYSDIGGLRVLDTSTMNALVGGDNSGIPIDDGVNTGHGLFLPRLGIAYRPMEKTVIRAGYGISADSNNWRFLRNAFPAVTISDFTGLSGFAAAPAGSLTGLNAVGPYAGLPIGIPAIPLTGGTAPGSFPLPDAVGTTTIPLDFRRGYINTFNLTVERQFAGFVGNVGYVGERGIRPLVNMNVNAAAANGGVNGQLLNAAFNHTTNNICPTATDPTAFCKGWPAINQLTPFGNNYYDSLQARLTRRFAGSSQIGFVYTFSKAIDYEDDEEINFLIFPYPAYLPRNKALAGFDRTHDFQAFGLYQLPFGRGQRYAQSGIAGALAGGWQLNWILSALSGTPFTITDTGTGATFLNAPGNTQTANIVGPLRILRGKPAISCPVGDTSCLYFDPTSFQQVTATTPGLIDGFFGNAGRDILRGPGYFDLDMSLMRNFKITERFTFQFEADAFGVTNTPHFNTPNANISAANFGAVTSTLVTTNASLGGSGGQRQWWFAGRLLF
jgi:Carboxypeptidase regulatory-like domain